MEISDYLQQVFLIIKNESLWIDTYFESFSGSALTSCLEQVLITDHCKIILEKGFHSLASAQRIDLLKLLFNLFKETNLIGELKAFILSYIKEQGQTFFKDVEGTKGISVIVAVKKIVDFKTLLDKIHSEAFCGNEQLRSSIRESFEAFLNSDLKPD